MKPVSVNLTRKLAKEHDTRGLIVLQFGFNSTHFSYTSYGKTKKDCGEMQKLADGIYDRIMSGELKVWEE